MDDIFCSVQNEDSAVCFYRNFRVMCGSFSHPPIRMHSVLYKRTAVLNTVGKIAERQKTGTRVMGLRTLPSLPSETKILACGKRFRINSGMTDNSKPRSIVLEYGLFFDGIFCNGYKLFDSLYSLMHRARWNPRLTLVLSLVQSI